MSLLLRAKLDAASNDYFTELYRNFGCIPEAHQTAITLRM
jgi:hypothetical protein